MDGCGPEISAQRRWRERVEADLRAVFPIPRSGPAPRLTGVACFRERNGRLRRVGPPPHARPAKAPASTAGRTVYAIGDVHGRYDLLCDLLLQIARDIARGAHEPLLILCGDYIDRGPHSALVLEALLWLLREAPWPVLLLKGNHEQVLLDFAEDPVRARAWLQFGGDAVFASYGLDPPDAGDERDLVLGRDALLDAMPASHLRLVQQLDVLAVVGDYAFVHAGVAPGTALRNQREADLLWIRGEFLESPRAADKIVVHGHSWTDDRPALLEHRIGLDTGAFATGVLTAVRLDGARRTVLQALDAAAAAARPVEGALVRRPANFTEGRVRLNLQFERPLDARPFLRLV